MSLPNATDLVPFLTNEQLVTVSWYYCVSALLSIVLLFYTVIMLFRLRRKINHLWNRILLCSFIAELCQVVQKSGVGWANIYRGAPMLSQSGLCTASFAMDQFLNVFVLGSYAVFLLVLIFPKTIGEGSLDTHSGIVWRSRILVLIVLTVAFGILGLNLGMHFHTPDSLAFGQASSAWCWIVNRLWWLKLISCYIFVVVDICLGTALVVLLFRGHASQYLKTWPVLMFIIGQIAWFLMLYGVQFHQRFLTEGEGLYHMSLAMAVLSAVNGAVISGLYIVCERLFPNRPAEAKGFTFFIAASSPIPAPETSAQEYRRKMLAANASFARSSSASSPPGWRSPQYQCHNDYEDRESVSDYFVGMASPPKQQVCTTRSSLQTEQGVIPSSTPEANSLQTTLCVSAEQRAILLKPKHAKYGTSL